MCIWHIIEHIADEHDVNRHKPWNFLLALQATEVPLNEGAERAALLCGVQHAARYVQADVQRFAAPLLQTGEQLTLVACCVEH